MEATLQAKPFLRWAGSKKKTLPELLKAWNQCKCDLYIEPFVGSGQLFFSINPKRAIISDINEDLINTYLQIQSFPIDVNKALSDIGPISEERYYSIRSLNPLNLNHIEKAARFIYLNRYCFNGLYRTNNSGQFNVPYASNRKTGTLINQEELLRCSDKLRNTKIVHGDFEAVIRQNLSKQNFIYLDPPYAISNKRVFKQYDPASFGLEDINRLKSLLNKINQKNSFFLLSYAYTIDTVNHFRPWNRKRIITQRNIAGFAENRKRAAELLVSNISIA